MYLRLVHATPKPSSKDFTCSTYEKQVQTYHQESDATYRQRRSSSTLRLVGQRMRLAFQQLLGMNRRSNGRRQEVRNSIGRFFSCAYCIKNSCSVVKIFFVCLVQKSVVYFKHQQPTRSRHDNTYPGKKRRHCGLEKRVP